MIDLTDMLIRHEGLKLKPYRCTAGKLTIGVGRNLDDMGITENEARYLLENDLGRIRLELDDALPWWRALDATRQAVLLDVAFNLGLTRLMGFKKFLHALSHGDNLTAAAELIDSEAARQCPRRYKELAALLQMPVDA